jgi:methyl-accepting chemotaxis protein
MTMSHRDAIVPLDPGQRSLDDLAAESSRLGVEMVDNAGSLDHADQVSKGQIGGVSGDAAFIRRVQEDAARLSAALEAAVALGRISIADLFSTACREVPGSDPAQYVTPFTRLADALFPPVQEAALARNRRIFDDRVGLKAGRGTAPVLLHVCRRDMGGGEYRTMKDLSVPILVSGRHWGGLGLAYTF